MSMQSGFPQTMRELSDRFKAERERRENERELLAAERSQYFRHYDDEPIPEHIIGELRREAEREDRIVNIWAWSFAAIVIGGLLGLCVWFLPSDLMLYVAITLLGSAAIGAGIIWYDGKKYPSGGRL